MFARRNEEVKAYTAGQIHPRGCIRRLTPLLGPIEFTNATRCVIVETLQQSVLRRSVSTKSGAFFLLSSSMLFSSFHMLFIERIFLFFLSPTTTRSLFSTLASNPPSRRHFSPFRDTSGISWRSFERSLFNALHERTWRSSNAWNLARNNRTRDEGRRRPFQPMMGGKLATVLDNFSPWQNEKSRNGGCRRRKGRREREKKVKSSLTEGNLIVSRYRVCRERCSARCSSSSRNKRARVRIVVVSTSRIYRETRR